MDCSSSKCSFSLDCKEPYSIIALIIFQQKPNLFHIKLKAKQLNLTNGEIPKPLGSKPFANRNESNVNGSIAYASRIAFDVTLYRFNNLFSRPQMKQAIILIPPVFSTSSPRENVYLFQCAMLI